jgi:hypothetical protein
LGSDGTEGQDIPSGFRFPLARTQAAALAAPSIEGFGAVLLQAGRGQRVTIIAAAPKDHNAALMNLFMPYLRRSLVQESPGFEMTRIHGRSLIEFGSGFGLPA